MGNMDKIKRAFKAAASAVTGKPLCSYKVYGGTIELHWKVPGGEHRRAIHDPWTLRDYIESGEKRGEDMSFEREAMQAYRQFEQDGERRAAQWREERANSRANRIKTLARRRRKAAYARP